MSATIFLLSPARCSGKRASLLLAGHAAFPLAVELRSERGAELGSVFSFLSGLYFRGKLAYARRFARPPAGSPGVLVITPTRGLAVPERRVTLADLREFSGVDLVTSEERYRLPLARDSLALRDAARGAARCVLLGSVATGKYVDVLAGVFGERLCFPADFVGRGDMSRGGLLLRRVAADEELPYVPVLGATRTGQRPPKLPRLGAAERRARNLAPSAEPGVS